jgi:hypothetical protein
MFGHTQLGVTRSSDLFNCPVGRLICNNVARGEADFGSRLSGIDCDQPCLPPESEQFGAQLLHRRAGVQTFSETKTIHHKKEEVAVNG